MSHNSIIIDTDSRFSIDAVTREIKNLSTTVKNKLIQYDHNSERIGFSMPRFIEGHDMTKCNRVEIHYKNKDTNTKEETAGVYEVQDVEIDTTNDEQITFSWLVSQNATQRVGLLCFLVRFACVDENSNIGYAWNTATFSGICVSEGMYNSDEIVEQYADVLEQWKKEFESGSGGGTVGESNVFIANYANSGEDGASCDVTFEELLEKHHEGKVIFAKVVLPDEKRELIYIATKFEAKKVTFLGYLGDSNLLGMVHDFEERWAQNNIGVATTKEIGDIETALDNIIAKYGLGGDTE